MAWYSSTPSTSASTPWRALNSSRSRTLSANGLASASRSFSASSPISCAQKPAKPNQGVRASRTNSRSISSSLPPRRAHLPSPVHFFRFSSMVGSALRSASSSSASQPGGSPATTVPRVAAPRHVAVKVSLVHVVLPNGAQIGKQAAKGNYHLYLVQAPDHVHIREQGQFPGSFPPPDKSPIVHGVATAGTGGGEAFGFLLVPASKRQDVQSESLLRRKPVIKATKPLLVAHPLLRAFSTASSASRRASSSSVSFILRSSSRSRA